MQPAELPNQRWCFSCASWIHRTDGCILNTHTLGTGCQNAATKGKDYAGRAAVTVKGLPCKPWSSTGYPSLPSNFCRNPSSGRGVWCYTSVPGTRWDYCQVPDCRGGQLLIMKKANEYPIQERVWQQRWQKQPWALTVWATVQGCVAGSTSISMRSVGPPCGPCNHL